MESATIVLPVQNAESTIQSTLEHLIEVLEDRYSQFKIIVEDRACTDGTIELVREFAKKVPQIEICHESDQPPETVIREPTEQQFTFENLDISEIQFDKKVVPDADANINNTPIDADDSFYQYLIDDDSKVNSDPRLGQFSSKTDSFYQGMSRWDKSHKEPSNQRHLIQPDFQPSHPVIASYHVG